MGSIYYASPSDVGTGDSFTKGGSGILNEYCTLTDAAASFNQSHLGAPITITGATSSANDGTFRIHRIVSTTEVMYRNDGPSVTENFAAGVTERWLARVDP